MIKILDFETSGPCFHSWGKVVMDRRQSQEAEEYLRLLYVAATRAEESIYFLSESLDKVKNESWRGRVSWPVCSLDENTETTSLGMRVVNHLGHQVLVGRHTLDDLKSAQQINVRQNLKETNIQPLNSSLMSEKINKRFKTVSVTSMIEDETKASGNQNSIGVSLVDAQLKALNGTRAHAIFESLKYLLSDAEGYEEPNLPMQFRNQFSTTEIKAVEYLQSLKEIPLMQILKNGYVEFGFKLKSNQTNSSSDPVLIQGQIDAWGAIDTEQGRKVYVIDYKTGDQKYREKAFLQLGAYADCLRKMNFILPADQVILATIFPIDEKVFAQELASLRPTTMI